MPKLCLGFVQKDSRPANPTSTGDFIHTYYLSELTIDGNGKFLTLRDTDGDPHPGGSPGTGNSRSAYLKKKPCFSFPSIKDFDLVDMRFKCDASQARRSVGGDIFDAYLLGCYSADVDDPDPDDALIKTWLFRTRLHPVLGMEYVDSNENRQERQPRFWTCFAVRDKVYCLFSARYGESRPAFWCHDPATGERETLAVPEFLVGPRKCFLCGYVFVAIHGEILVCLVNMEFYSYNVKLGIWRRVAFRAELNDKPKPPLDENPYAFQGEVTCADGDTFYVLKVNALLRYTLKIGTNSLELICSGVFRLPPHLEFAQRFSKQTDWQWIHPFSDNLLCIIMAKYDPAYDRRASICFSMVFLLEDSFLMMPVDSVQEMVESDICEMSCFIVDAEPRLCLSTSLDDIAQKTVQELQYSPLEAGVTGTRRPYAEASAVLYLDQVSGSKTVVYHPEKIREARLKRRSHGMSLFVYGTAGFRSAFFRLDVGQDGRILAGSEDRILQPIYAINMEQGRRNKNKIVLFQGAVVDRKLYLVPFEVAPEGCEPSFDTLVLDTAQMELSFNRRMKTAKAWGLVMSASKKIYVLENVIEDEVPQTHMESYDPRADLWEDLPSPHPQIGNTFHLMGYAVVDNRFIIISLLPMVARPTASIEYYSFDTQQCPTQSWSCVKKDRGDQDYDLYDGKAECVNRNIFIILERSVVAFPVVGEHPNFQLCAPVVLVDDIIPGVRMGAYRRWTKCMAHLGDLRFCVLVAIHNKGGEPNSLHAVTFRALLDGNKGHLVLDPDSFVFSDRLFHMECSLVSVDCFVG